MSTPPCIPQLIDRIVDTHHVFVREQSAVISSYLATLAAEHGAARPDLLRLRAIFGEMAADLLLHLQKEEGVLFPYMRALDAAARAGGTAPCAPFGTVANPIRMMEEEHRRANAALWLARTLTFNYTAPAEACATWRACYAALEAFEADLRAHTDLEDDVLFRAVLALERRQSAVA